MQGAGYFHIISQSSKLTVKFVEIPEKGEMKDRTDVISSTMEQIENLEPDVILLNTKKERTELLLQQVQFNSLFFYFV